MAFNYLRRAASAVTAALFLTSVISAVPITANAGLSEITAYDGYDYEYWSENNDPLKFELDHNGGFNASWDTYGNCFFAKGLINQEPTSNNYKVDYDVSINFGPVQNATANDACTYLCAYGFLKNPAAEFFFTDYDSDISRYDNSESFTPLGSFTTDGKTYDLYNNRVIKNSIEGNYSYDRYISIRRGGEMKDRYEDDLSWGADTEYANYSGQIDVGAHFEALEKLGKKIGDLERLSFNVESYRCAGEVKLNSCELTEQSENTGEAVTIDELGGCNYAKIVMEAPDSTLEFKNITENDLQTQKIMNYTGTVEANGETYLVARKKANIMYNTTLAEIETDHNDYIFYHVCSEESLPAEGFVFPFYELIQSAKHFGLATGTLRSVTLDGNNYDCNCELSELQNKDKKISCKVYSEISKRYMGYIILDGYDFYSPEYYVMRGSEMIARPKGCFTINAQKYELMYNENYVDSYMEKNLSRTSPYELNAQNNISIDYKADDSLEGKYGVVYKFYLSDPAPDKRISFSIAEKVSGMSAEELFRSYEKSLGVGNHLSFIEAELVKTYTAGGIEYDLYKGLYRYYGEFSSYNEESYIAVRKDTGNSNSYGNSIDVYEHMSNIDELHNDTEVYSVELSFHNCGAEGTLDFTRNDISFVSAEAPEFITGDLNNDRRVDSFDIITARKALVSISDNEAAKTNTDMDLNKDGSFNIADIVLLQSFVLGKTESFS